MLIWGSNRPHETLSFSLVPADFFSENPSIDVPSERNLSSKQVIYGGVNGTANGTANGTSHETHNGTTKGITNGTNGTATGTSTISTNGVTNGATNGHTNGACCDGH